VQLSDRFKHCFKVALAMALTYAIALDLNWGKPFWAALSVAFCSLATAGDSINRGIQRVVGTVLSGVGVAILMSLFPQDRWMFLAALSVVIGVCTYQMSGGSRFWFVWFCAAFNMPVLAILGGPIALNSFNIMVLRAQETALGVVVYSIVAVLLWPRRGDAEFEQAVATACESQRMLFDGFLRRVLGDAEGGHDDPDKLRTRLTTATAGAGHMLEGALYDSDDLWQSRHAWRRLIGILPAINQALERWRMGLHELDGVELGRLLPGLDQLRTEIDGRFATIGDMLEGRAPAAYPGTVALALDRQAMRTVSHVHRAAVVLFRDQLRTIETLTRSMWESVADIRGFGPPVKSDPPQAPWWAATVPDIDRLAAVVRQTATLWLVLLGAIFLPGFPFAVATITLANAFAMAFSPVPHVPARVLLLPTVAGTVFAGILYMFVMPRMSTFAGLGSMIFLATFLIGYLFYEPKAGPMKAMGLCMLVCVIGAQDPQSFSFQYFSAWFMAGVIFVGAMMVAWRFPISFRPEDRFEPLLRRFFRSGEFLLAHPQPPAGTREPWTLQWRRAFHSHEVKVLPQRIQLWGGALPEAALGRTSRADVQSLAVNLQVLGTLITEFTQVDPGETPRPALEDVLGEIREWRASVCTAFRGLSADPGSLDPAGFRSGIKSSLHAMEQRVDGVVSRMGGSMSDQQGAGLYQVLGTYRGLSEALVDFSGRIAHMDWGRLRESRL